VTHSESRLHHSFDQTCDLKTIARKDSLFSGARIARPSLQIAIEVGLTIARTVWVLFVLMYMSNSRRSCGNVDSRSDFQGRWEGWKPAFGFPCFPPVVISTALPPSLKNGCLQCNRSFAVQHERKQLRLLVDHAIGKRCAVTHEYLVQSE
jgi:hypothetical protein